MSSRGTVELGAVFISGICRQQGARIATTDHYGFAVYRKRGTGAQVLKTTSISAGRLPTVRWHGDGDHRGTEQAKLAIEDVF